MNNENNKIQMQSDEHGGQTPVVIDPSQKHTAVLMQKKSEGSEQYRWVREGDNIPLSPIFTNIQAAVDFPKRNPLLTDDEWRKGENVVEEPIIIGPNG